MKTIHLFFIALFLASPDISSAGEITVHSIVVPDEFAWGRSQEAFAGTSPIERYVDTYEKTWWNVMNAFVNDKPDWQNFSNFICSGTPAASQACIDAYDAAFNRINSLLKTTNNEDLKEMIRPYLGQ
jgi:hypothetical protein